uniref:Uncharacterized protein n=1 Tax=Panagrolaimus sp. ES5 TaxID=591445 RepID=A0AC34F7T5_9BILA
MEHGSYVMHPSPFRHQIPQPKMVVTLKDKFGIFFNELVKLALFKSNPQHSSFYDLLSGCLSPEDFVIYLGDIFGSYQPYLLHFLMSEPFFSQPFSLETPEGQAVANGDQYFPNGNPSFPNGNQSVSNRHPSFSNGDQSFSKRHPSFSHEDHSFSNRRPSFSSGDQSFSNRHPSFSYEDHSFDDSLEIPDMNVTFTSPTPSISPEIHVPLPKVEPPSSSPFPIYNEKKFLDQKKDVKPVRNKSTRKSKEKRKAATVTASATVTPTVKKEKEVTENKPLPVIFSPQKINEPLSKSVYVEPDDTLLNPDEVLKYMKKKRVNFKSISQDAINSMAEFVNVEIRVFSTKVLDATKARQTAPLLDTFPDDDTEAVPNDIKTQINVLDAYYLANDLKDAKSEEGKKMVNARNNRKRDLEEMHNVANEVARAALGGKKRNWGASSSKASKSRSNTFIKTYRIHAQDVLFAMHHDKRLQNSWAYRNAVRIHSFAYGSAYSTSSRYS